MKPWLTGRVRRDRHPPVERRARRPAGRPRWFGLEYTHVVVEVVKVAPKPLVQRQRPFPLRDHAAQPPAYPAPAAATAAEGAAVATAAAAARTALAPSLSTAAAVQRHSVVCQRGPWREGHGQVDRADGRRVGVIRRQLQAGVVRGSRFEVRSMFVAVRISRGCHQGEGERGKGGARSGGGVRRGGVALWRSYCQLAKPGE